MQVLQLRWAFTKSRRSISQAPLGKQISRRLPADKDTLVKEATAYIQGERSLSSGIMSRLLQPATCMIPFVGKHNLAPGILCHMHISSSLLSFTYSLSRCGLLSKCTCTHPHFLQAERLTTRQWQVRMDLCRTKPSASSQVHISLTLQRPQGNH